MEITQKSSVRMDLTEPACGAVYFQVFMLFHEIILNYTENGFLV